MARLVGALGTSHSPLLSIPGEMWPEYAQFDRFLTDLVFPPDGWAMPFDEALHNYVPESVSERLGDADKFLAQAKQCRNAIGVLADTWESLNPDVTVIVSDDQDEWFFDTNMPAFAVYWGDSAPLVPWRTDRFGPQGSESELARLIAEGYGDKAMDIPVASDLGRHVIEYLIEHEFDIAHMHELQETYGGNVVRRYPTKTAELETVVRTAPRVQGLPHGYSFIVKHIFRNRSATIIPVLQNTCYPPNTPTARRCRNFGRAIAAAVEEWPGDERVVVVASGGLSHFVVDEELDNALLSALASKNADGLDALPRHRLQAAASESLNWVTVGGAMESSALNFDLTAYVPVYRTEAGTGGGWAFGRWV